jgi:hypothetical protein
MPFGPFPAIRPLLTRTQRASAPAAGRFSAQCLRNTGSTGDAPGAHLHLMRMRSMVAFDYHVEMEQHYYSVPHALVGHSVCTLHGFHRGNVLPQRAHRKLRTLLPARCAHDAGRTHAEVSSRACPMVAETTDPRGESIGAIVEHLLRSKPHPEQGYRACLGLLALACEYGEQRLESS